MTVRFLAISLSACFIPSLFATTEIDLGKATRTVLEKIDESARDYNEDRFTDPNAINIHITNYKKIVSEYVANGGDINKAINDDKQTALILVAQNQEQELVQILLDAEADATITDSSNKTALTHALQERNNIQRFVHNSYHPQNHKNTVRYLLNSINQKDRVSFINKSIAPFIKKNISDYFDKISKDSLTQGTKRFLENFKRAHQDTSDRNIPDAKIVRDLAEFKKNYKKIIREWDSLSLFLQQLEIQEIISDTSLITQWVNRIRAYVITVSRVSTDINKARIHILKVINMIKKDPTVVPTVLWVQKALEGIIDDKEKQNKLAPILIDCASRGLLNYYLES